MSLVEERPAGYSLESAQKAAALRARVLASRAKPDLGTLSPRLHEKSEHEIRTVRYDALRSLVIQSFWNLNISVGSENYSGRKIQFVTAVSFDVRLVDLLGQDIRREFSSPRHLCMYVMHENFELSYGEIGKLFDRTESSARQGLKSFERLLEYGDATGNTAPFHDLVTHISRECSTDMRAYQGYLVTSRAAQG